MLRYHWGIRVISMAMASQCLREEKVEAASLKLLLPIARQMWTLAEESKLILS